MRSFLLACTIAVVPIMQTAEAAGQIQLVEIALIRKQHLRVEFFLFYSHSGSRNQYDVAANAGRAHACQPSALISVQN